MLAQARHVDLDRCRRAPPRSRQWSINDDWVDIHAGVLLCLLDQLPRELAKCVLSILEAGRLGPNAGDRIVRVGAVAACHHLGTEGGLGSGDSRRHCPRRAQGRAVAAPAQACNEGESLVGLDAAAFERDLVREVRAKRLDERVVLERRPARVVLAEEGRRLKLAHQRQGEGHGEQQRAFARVHEDVAQLGWRLAVEVGGSSSMAPAAAALMTASGVKGTWAAVTSRYLSQVW